jgi:hypothetical protein
LREEFDEVQNLTRAERQRTVLEIIIDPSEFGDIQDRLMTSGDSNDFSLWTNPSSQLGQSR